MCRRFARTQFLSQPGAIIFLISIDTEKEKKGGFSPLSHDVEKPGAKQALTISSGVREEASFHLT